MINELNVFKVNNIKNNRQSSFAQGFFTIMKLVKPAREIFFAALLIVLSHSESDVKTLSDDDLMELNHITLDDTVDTAYLSKEDIRKFDPYKNNIGSVVHNDWIGKPDGRKIIHILLINDPMDKHYKKVEWQNMSIYDSIIEMPNCRILFSVVSSVQKLKGENFNNKKVETVRLDMKDIVNLWERLLGLTRYYLESEDIAMTEFYLLSDFIDFYQEGFVDYNNGANKKEEEQLFDKFNQVLNEWDSFGLAYTTRYHYSDIAWDLVEMTKVSKGLLGYRSILRYIKMIASGWGDRHGEECYRNIAYKIFNIIKTDKDSGF